jgi:hypothetical protein
MAITMEDYTAARTKRNLEHIYKTSGYPIEEFEAFYNNEYQKLGFIKGVEILTAHFNPHLRNPFRYRKYRNEKNIVLLLAAYAKDGGDLEYFTAGAGAPGNCVIS